jgi:iron complex outermembrane receptor protein
MKTASVKATALCATCIAALLGTPAMAQGAGAGNDADTIVVTARRVEERAQDVPISITTFSPQQIEDRNIVSTTDLAAYTPSLQVNTKYGPDKASFIIRGFSQDQNTAPTVAVYFADVVAPRLQSNIGGGNGAGPGSLFDLQNIQVLKGPQGTLFGRNTTGGAILLVPKKPTDKLEGYVEGTYGNHDEKRVQAVLNVPLSDTFKVRMGIDRNERDGYLHNRSGIGPDEFNNVNYTAARLSIVANLTPDLENDIVASYVHSNTHGGLPKFLFCQSSGTTGIAALLAGANTVNGTGTCGQVAREKAQGYGYYDVENNDPNPFVRSTTWQIIDTTTWQASDMLTVKNIASYGEARESYSFSLDGDNTSIPFVIVRPGPNGGQGSESTFTEEFQLQGRTPGDRFSWQAGAYTEISDPIGAQTQYTQTFASCANDAAAYSFMCGAPLGSTSSVSQAHNTYKYKNYALYAQATYKLTDHLDLTGGIRETWDWEREFADNTKVTVSPTGPIVRPPNTTAYICSRTTTPPGAGPELLYDGACGIGRTFTTKSAKPTWLINLDYKPSRDVLVYAKYARGYRAGGINEANFGAEVWHPEKVDDYEVGLKTSFHGPISGTFDIDGYWNNFKNQQATVSIPNCVAIKDPVSGAITNGCTNGAITGISGIENIGKSRMRGIEVDGSLSYGNLRLDYGYAYLSAKVLSASVPFCDPTRYACAQAAFFTPGSTLTYSPKNRVTVTGTYTLPTDPKIGRISVSATFTHTDKQVNITADQATFAKGLIPFDPGLSPATDLVNLAVNWRGVLGTPFDVSAFATNLTNQHYWVASAAALTTLGAEAVALGEPRMYGVRLRYSFGS